MCHYPRIFEYGRTCDALTLSLHYDYFERLGPKVRHALNHACVTKWSPLDILREAHRRGFEEPFSPEEDAALAKEVIKLDRQLFPRDPYKRSW